MVKGNCKLKKKSPKKYHIHITTLIITISAYILLVRIHDFDAEGLPILEKISSTRQFYQALQHCNVGTHTTSR
jgi:hypothetical protein